MICICMHGSSSWKRALDDCSRFGQDGWNNVVQMLGDVRGQGEGYYENILQHFTEVVIIERHVSVNHPVNAAMELIF